MASMKLKEVQDVDLSDAVTEPPSPSGVRWLPVEGFDLISVKLWRPPSIRVPLGHLPTCARIQDLELP